MKYIVRRSTTKRNSKAIAPNIGAVVPLAATQETATSRAELQRKLDAARNVDGIDITITTEDMWVGETITIPQKSVAGPVKIYSWEPRVAIIRNPNNGFSGPFFHVPKGAELTLSIITVDGGNKKVASPLVFNEGTLILEGDAILTGGNNTGDGGAIRSIGRGSKKEDKAKVIIEKAFVTENTARFGGGIYAENSIVELKCAAITKNKAVQGGGLYLHSDAELIVTPGDDCYNGGVLVKYTELGGNEAELGPAIYAVREVVDNLEVIGLDLDPTWIHDNECETKSDDTLVNPNCEPVNIEIHFPECEECLPHHPGYPGGPGHPGHPGGPGRPGHPGGPGHPGFLPPGSCPGGYNKVTFVECDGMASVVCVAPASRVQPPPPPRNGCSIFHGWSKSKSGYPLYNFNDLAYDGLVLYPVWTYRPCP